MGFLEVRISISHPRAEGYACKLTVKRNTIFARPSFGGVLAYKQVKHDSYPVGICPVDHLYAS